MLATTPAHIQPPEPLIEAPSALDEFIDNAVITAPPEPQEPPNVEALISQIASEVDVASTTLYNLVKYESDFVETANGDGGCSLGLTQQNVCVNKDITREQALDPEWSLRRAATDIKEGLEARYMVCNCWGYIKANFIPNLPRTAEILPNSEPKVGSVAIFRYSNGITHYAYVSSVSEGSFSVREANLKPCVVGKRNVDMSDSALVGFWYPY